MFDGLLYRDHCAFDKDMRVYANNLCDVLRMHKMRINEDPNSPEFLSNPSNGIIISSFYNVPKDATIETAM